MKEKQNIKSACKRAEEVRFELSRQFDTRARDKPSFNHLIEEKGIKINCVSHSYWKEEAQEEKVTIFLSETVVFVRCCKVSEIKVAQPTPIA